LRPSTKIFLAAAAFLAFAGVACAQNATFFGLNGEGGPIISSLTYYESDSTIVATWTTNVPANSNITCGSHSGIDNGVAASSTSHQAICVDLSASTGYATHVTSGSTSSSTTTQTTNSAQVRIPISQVAFGTLANAKFPVAGDGMTTFVSSDGNQYANQNDGYGWTSMMNAGANMQIGIINNLTPPTLIGSNVNLLTNYGGFATCNGTDGPSGDCLSNKLNCIFGLAGDLFACQYRGDPNDTLYGGEVYFGNWMRSNDHGATWNSWQAPSVYNANGVPPTPQGSYQFASPGIAQVEPIRYAADDGTLGYTTAGNLIDGANGFVYLPYKLNSDNTDQYLMRIPRIQFQAQNAAAIQYWSGTCPSTAAAAPAAFVSDSNWSSSLGSAVACYNATGPVQISEETFVSGLNRYIMLVTTFGVTDAGVAPHLFNPAMWTILDGVTPVGPWTPVAQYFNGPLGFYTPSVVHSTVAGNSATSNIALQMMYATYPTGYGTNLIPLTLLPASSSSVMQQLQQYTCAPPESPISFSGNFVTPTTGSDQIKSVGGYCEPTTPSSGVAGMSIFTGPPVTGDTGGTWPADQYASTTVGATLNSTGFQGPAVRMSTASSGYFIDAYVAAGPPTVNLDIITAGSATLLEPCGAYTPAPHDTWTISAVGTTITGYLNGVSKCVATDSTYASGYPGIWQYSTGASSDSQIEQFNAGAFQAATPVFSTYAAGFSGNVTITCPTSGSTVYYTYGTSATQPTRSSSTVTCGGTVAVTPGHFLAAMAAASDMADSMVTTVPY
jgi:hypothetical protein